MLREFLYIDVKRVRSLLSQLDGGVVDTVVERRSQGDGGTFGFNALGIQGVKSLETGNTEEQSRSMQDLLYTIFEEACESEGLLAALTDDLYLDSEAWQTAKVHDRLTEGQLVKVFWPIRVVDPNFIRARFERFTIMNDLFAEIGRNQVAAATAEIRAQAEVEIEARISALPPNQQPSARKRSHAELQDVVDAAVQAAASQALEPVTDGIRSTIEAVNILLASDALSIRFTPCGDERPDLGFVGSLLGRDEYIQREREALLTRYGTKLQGWTAVLQVAAIPTPESRLEAIDFEVAGAALISGDALNRGQLEQLAMGLLAKMDSLGISDGPLWPSISVVPLAIYRVVPGSDGSGSVARRL